MSVAVCIVIIAVVCIFVFRPFLTARGRIGRSDAEPGGVSKLIEEREVLIDAIRELDFDHRMGKVEEDDYRGTRSRFEHRAVQLMRAIEETAGPAPNVEDRIEAEIAALRKKETVNCALCGCATPDGARFCPQCGSALAESHP